jgi:hypothetical protein
LLEQNGTRESTYTNNSNISSKVLDDI